MKLSHLREDRNPAYKLTDVLEIHFIELAKFRKIRADLNNPLERWLQFLEPTSEEVLKMIKDHDPSIAKAEKILDWLGTDEETIRLYELREKAIHDEVTRLLGAREEGKQEGIKEGIKEGIREGIKEGVKETQREVIKNMLNMGIDIDIICEVTKLSKDEIEKIKQHMH